MEIQLAGFLDNSLVNGEGIRSVVFVSGCRHNCEGCHNKAMQDFNYGDTIEIDHVFRRIKNNIPIINGVTFSGGEPFEQPKALFELAKKVKKQGLDIWCYSGYTFEEILNSGDFDKIKLLTEIDVLIDGKFKKELTDGAPKYAGSRNQRIIDVKASLRCKKITIYSKKENKTVSEII